ncbi:MAG: DUF58 domain-containing protein [Gemmatimonadota bacterium]
MRWRRHSRDPAPAWRGRLTPRFSPAELWRRIRSWRRIHFTTGGFAFTLGAFAVGFAAMNTGNNLLYLLLGAMLGFIAVSGWLSEKAISGLRVRRRIPRAVPVGQDLLLSYQVENRKARLPSMGLDLREAGLPHSAFLPHVAPGATAECRSVNRFDRRGIYPLENLTLSTAFPFGLFVKERDLKMPGEIIVWPRTDRPVHIPPSGAGGMRREGVNVAGAAGQRGEYRSLRTYRAGDDPRDIHWRSSARQRQPVLREYERDGAEARWICLDTRADPGEAAEAAVEVAASLATRSFKEARPFALVTPDAVLEAAEGAAHLERVLDALARVDFHPDAPLPVPPVDRAACILVSVFGAPDFPAQIVVGPHATSTAAAP